MLNRSESRDKPIYLILIALLLKQLKDGSWAFQNVLTSVSYKGHPLVLRSSHLSVFFSLPRLAAEMNSDQTNTRLLPEELMVAASLAYIKSPFHATHL